MYPFKDDCAAKEHLLWHVLTPQESHAWHEVWSRSFDELEESEPSLNSCYRLRDELANHSGLESPELPLARLLDAYCKAIVSQRSEAEALGWWTDSGGVRATLDTNGIFCIWNTGSAEQYVSTAFLPGFGSAEATVASRETPSDPHARVVGKSWMRGERNGERGSRVESSTLGIKDRLKQRRACAWTDSERLYYLVFRVVVQFIRRLQGEHCSGIGLASLKQVLPPMSRLKYESWMQLRSMAGGHYE